MKLQGHLPSYLLEMVFHMRLGGDLQEAPPKLSDVPLFIAAFKFVPGLLDLHAKCRYTAVTLCSSSPNDHLLSACGSGIQSELGKFN